MMKKNISLIEEFLDEIIENPRCELDYNKDYELLIAIMLSAQTTDKGVNKVTKVLFSKYDSLEKLANANLDDLKEIIRPIGNYNRKAINIIEISKSLLLNYNGVVPATFEELETFKGVGHKTASVLVSELFNIPAFAVDTHVIRVSNRLKLVKSKDPIVIEKKLKKIFKKDLWGKRHKQMVLFGRYHCKAKNPECANCKLKDICFKNLDA